MITDARYFPPEAADGAEDSEYAEAEVGAAEDMLASSEFDVESGIAEIAAEFANGPIYLSPLAAPPKSPRSLQEWQPREPLVFWDWPVETRWHIELCRQNPPS